MSLASADLRVLDYHLTEAAGRFGTPSYVYFTEIAEARLADLQSAFGRWFAISYAVKSNPNPALLDWIRGRVEYLDVSSGGELGLARQAGWDPARISFTGPAKRELELRGAISAGIGELVVESLREAQLADSLAAELGLVQPVVIRISPDRVPKGFGDQMAGRPSPFGIDIEDAPSSLQAISGMPNLQVIGLHIYSGTQCLKPEAICENWRIFIEIFGKLCAGIDLTPKKLIFGSGLGIPYHPGDVPLHLSAITENIRGDLDEFSSQARFSRTRFVLELGRYLIGPAGYFLTRVVSVKQSRGTRIAICDGGLNANLAASGHFGMIIRRNYTMHRVGQREGDPDEKQDLTGPLCTSIDKLGSGVFMPHLEEGDVVAVHNGGAYGPTASPIHFISQPLPREIIVTGKAMRDVTQNVGR